MENIKNKIVRLKISSVHCIEENTNENIYSYEKVKQSISEFGQTKNIVVCQTEQGFECLDGTKILKALKELNQDTVIAFNVGQITEQEKEKIRKYLENEEPLLYFLGDLDLKNVKEFKEEPIKKAESFKAIKEKEEIEANEQLSPVKEQEIIADEVPKTEEKQEVKQEIESVKEEINEVQFQEFSHKEFIKKESENKYIITDVQKQVIEQNKDVLVLPNGEEVCCGDLVTISTKRKTNFTVTLMKFTKKWVHYVEEETGKGLSIDYETFVSTCKTLKAKVETEKNPLEGINIHKGNPENAYDDKFYILKGTGVVSEINEISIDKEFDERYGKAYEQATNELIEEKEEQDKSLNWLEDTEEEKSEATTEEVDFSIDFSEISKDLEEIIEKDLSDDKVIFYVDKAEESLIVLNSTRDIILFLQNEVLSTFNKISKGEFERPTINFTVDTEGKITIKESTIFNRRKESKTINIYELESILKNSNYSSFYQVSLNNSSFYFDYKRGTIFLKQNIETILSNLKSIAKNLINDKFKSEVEEEQVNYSISEKENGEVEIISINSKNNYGVVIRVQLIDVANILFKIDF
jgi:hypothetical protein